MGVEDNILLGTSGWGYEEWVGPFYTTREKKFSSYARVFRTTEINSTFYRYPTSGMIRGLLRAAPKGFVFSAKMPKIITHKKRLDLSLGVDDDLKRFLKLMEPMREAGKLGPILIQLPPRFEYDQAERLSRFLDVLPSEFRFAVEFRSLSWLRSETWSLLKERNVAYTIVDEPLIPPKMVFTADFAYLRWHGRGGRPWFNYRYSEDELKEWVPRVKLAAEKTRVVYGYFNNHFHAYAPENCLRLLEMLGKATRLQVKVRERIDSYIRGKTEGISAPPSTVDEALKLNLSQLLRGLTDEGRINRAETIRESHVSIKRGPRGEVTAKIKEYTVEIDPSRRTILHNCEDWIKILSEKRLCKHVVRVFLSLPLESSKKILADLLVNREKWRFEAD